MDQIQLSKSTIQMNITVFKWIDNNIHQIYAPTLELSSYGNTKEAVTEMITFSLNELAFDMSIIHKRNIEYTLFELGWRQNPLEIGNMTHHNIDKDEIVRKLALQDIELVEEIFLINYLCSF